MDYRKEFSYFLKPLLDVAKSRGVKIRYKDISRLKFSFDSQQIKKSGLNWLGLFNLLFVLEYDNFITFNKKDYTFTQSGISDRVFKTNVLLNRVKKSSLTGTTFLIPIKTDI